MKLLFALIVLVLSYAAQAANEIDDKVKAAMAAESRPEADVARDKNRRPVETLNFFGMKDNMKVMELLPGRGWYTRILAPTLRDNGELYVALGTGRAQEALAGESGFDRVNFVESDDNLRWDPDAGGYVVDDFEFGVNDLDLVVTFRNLHNFSAAHRKEVNAEVFRSLKSGGLYGVIDHTARHMEPANPENGRRMDPVLAIYEILQAGFEFAGYSDLHYRADDELEYEVGRRSVSGNTDRFTLLFRKP